ncbi:MAG TPA: type 1 glutamine amidotransferase [Bryobacteraceae bacterium]|nr:type 1 glutamine amidotransferase [Bryobacteraceae bacterium]
MRVVVFRHVRHEGLGLIEPVLRRRGFEILCADLYRPGAESPETRDAAGLIFMGGPMSANDPLPYLQREMEIMREAAGRGQPVLGVCLGAQLLAKALGAQVRRNPLPEIGWFPVELTEAGAADSLLSAMNRSETVLQWHNDTFDLPEGAVQLARSERCANQAFRVGPNLYGFQYHLEATPEMIADWCAQDAQCGDARELDTPIDPQHNRERLAYLAGQVFGRWSDSLIPR